MAEITLQRLKEIKEDKYPSNSLIDYYDIIHKLIEAHSLEEGIKFKGEGSHTDLINYAAKKFNLTEKQRIFLQDLRNKRNRISYEGLIITKDYLLRNRDKLLKLIKELKNNSK